MTDHPFSASFGSLAGGLGLTDGQKKSYAWANAAAYAGDLSRRIDCDGRIVCWSEYGKHSALGWEIDHVNAIALGGGDYPANLRARHWMGNSRAGGLLGGLMGGLLGLGSR